MKRSTSLLRRAIRPLVFILYLPLTTGHVGATESLGNSVQIKVIGKLVPPACSLALSAGDTADFGRTLITELALDNVTLLPERRLPFTINCGTPAKVSLTMLDENHASVVYDLIETVRSEDDAGFMANGLGAVDGVNIGIFYVRVITETEVNRPGRLRTVRQTGLHTWIETPVDAPLYAHDRKAVGFSDGESSTPTPFATVSGHFAIQPVIRKRSELPANREIALAGSSTVTLHYD